MSCEARLKRLFGKDGNCFDVAIDHGFFNEMSFLDGIHDIESAVKTVVEANPDAIQLTVGQAKVLQKIPGKEKPSLVLRTDVANVYGKILPKTLFSEMISDPVEQALKLDAACVVCNIFLIPKQEELYHQCIKNVNKLKPMCEKFGMPLMIEPLVMKEGQGGYEVDGDIKKILPLVRQSVELGADIIKADPTIDVKEYHKVIKAAGNIPVLVRGGSKSNDKEILSRTFELMKQGAKGIVYGRNVIQHKSPNKMTKALMSIVHDQKTDEEAFKLLEE